MHFLPLINLIKQKTQPFLVKTKQERESQSPLRNILDEMTGQIASKVAFPIFHIVLLYFSPNECPGLCRQIRVFFRAKNYVALNENKQLQSFISNIKHG